MLRSSFRSGQAPQISPSAPLQFLEELALPWVNRVVEPALECSNVRLQDEPFHDPLPKTHGAISRRGIEIVQAALNNASYKIESDGYMTKGTREALKTYQADHKLKVTGTVDPATLKNLNIKNFEKWR